jgi:hypothetical protein
METATFPTLDDAQVMEIERHLQARRQQGQDWVYLSGTLCGAAARKFYRNSGYLVRCNTAPEDPSGFRVLIAPASAAAHHYQ